MSAIDKIYDAHESAYVAAHERLRGLWRGMTQEARATFADDVERVAGSLRARDPRKSSPQPTQPPQRYRHAIQVAIDGTSYNEHGGFRYVIEWSRPNTSRRGDATSLMAWFRAMSEALAACAEVVQ